MIIDAYNHVVPKKYQQAVNKNVTGRDMSLPSSNWDKMIPTLADLDARFRVMDAFDGYIQVISVASPPSYNITPTPVAVELAKIANDELANMVHTYPDRFAAGIATMPLNDPEAAVMEAERAIKDLRLRGVEIGTDLYGKAIDGPEFMPLYEKMEQLDRPIFIHPLGEFSTPDYKGEKASKYRLWTKVGWPYATTMAVCRLVYSGVFDRYPNLKIVTHHCGGLIPYLAGRFDWADDFNEMTAGQRDIDLKEKGLAYFKRIYYDTAVNGNTAALNCAREVMGLDQMLFGTDVPFDNQFGRRLIRQTIESVERMELTAEQKQQIYQDNAIKLLRLPLGAI